MTPQPDRRAHRYVPVQPGSLLWLVLVAVTTVVNAVMLPSIGRGGSRWDASAAKARAFVAASWGAQPDPSARLERRNFLHGALILLFVVCAVPSVALFVLGSLTDQGWLAALGGLALGVSALILGLDGPLVARSFFMNLDFHKWNAAGRPESWPYTPASQLRSSDLIWAGAWGLALASFFVALTLG